MAKCKKCGHRKAKRHCPALGSDICNLCCGLLREKEIHCPPQCSYLAQHRPYQEKRVLEKKETPRSRREIVKDDIASDDRMRWLLVNAEAPLKEFAEGNPALTDREAILALEYAKEKVEKGRGRLILPGEDHKPKNRLGEAVYKSVDNCRYERPIILTSSLETYKQEEKLRVLRREILTAKAVSEDNLEGRTYLQQIIDRFAKIKDLSQKQKVITLE
jgi:hypothetical protein